MSSSSTRKPEFRLQMGYPYITLTRVGEDEPIGVAAADAADFAPAMRALAAEVARTRGTVTAVLPDGEVWRGLLALSGRTPAERRAAAQRQAAVALAVPPQALLVVLGRPAAGGATPVAAVRRDTLSDALALLATVGIRPTAIYGDGPFPGFAASPRLAGRWRIALATLRRRRQAAAFGASALGAAATALFALTALAPAPSEAPIEPFAPPAAIEVAAVVPEPAAEVPPVPPKAAPAPRIVRSAPPMPRPQPEPMPLPEPVSKPMMQAAARVTVATRNYPALVIEPRRTAPAGERVAELTGVGTPMIDAIAIPLRRPAATTVKVDAAPSSDLRPQHRPARPSASPTRAAAAAPDDGRPAPRPVTTKALVVAALAPTAAIAATDGYPPARPDTVRRAAPAAKPAPVGVVRTQPAPVAAPAPKNVVMRAAPSQALRIAPAPAVRTAPQPARVAAVPKRVAAQPVRVASVPQRVTAPAPVRVAAVPQRAAAQPKAVPAKEKARRTTTRTGFSRGNVALIGVFSAEGGRHALLRLPNGDVQRVRAGDSVQGVQVAAVSEDSVRLSGRGRDTLLKLPD